MEVQLIRDGTKVQTLPVSDENVSLLARSLLPCQISQVQITEYIVKQLLAQISEKDSEIPVDLQKSVVKHQLDEAKQEKANLVEHIRKLTQTIDITEKELSKRVGIESKLSSELEQKEKIISDLKAKLSALEEIQSELELQGIAKMKVGSQYSDDDVGIKDSTTLDGAQSKAKILDEEDKTLQQSTSVSEGSEMETATSTQPEMTVREGKKKDSGGIFSKISKRIFGRKEKSDGSTAMPESKQEQRSSVSAGSEEMPSGSVSSKMSGGTATTGSKSGK
ncbi:peptidoglycan DL-endopeptidase CwlO-like [Ptychodera flava]|uniref:peptidoglycan DL-endopeptidase CwlO-like n=1 Tax=Ptychodera flava TaxID=63121 RepID=UPI003969C341